MKTSRARWWFSALVLACIAVSLLTVPVYAYLYRAPIAIIESSSNDYEPFTALIDAPVTWMVDNGFIATTTALDTRVETSAGIATPHMMADDKILAFLSSLNANSQVNRYFTTGNTPLTSFPVIVGDGGYVTIADASGLELGDDFEIEFEGWIDTSSILPLYPIVESTATSTEDSVVTSHDVTLPSGVESGDLLLMLFACIDSAGGSPVLTWPGGWTNLDKRSGTYSAGGAAYKIATGSEGSTVIVTTTQTGTSAHQTFRISNYRGTPEITAEATGGGADDPDSPNLEPSWSVTSHTLWFTLFTSAFTDTGAINAYPGEYSGGQSTICGASHAQVGSARREYADSEEDPGGFNTGTITSWAAWTIAVKGNLPLIGKARAFRVYIDDDDVIAELLGVATSLYKEGLYEGDWVVGYSLQTGSQSKETDHLYLQAAYSGYAERTYVTDSVMSMTGVDTLYIDWENTGSAEADQYSCLVVSTVKGDPFSTYDARLLNSNVFSRQVDSLDVSGLSGDCYIRVHARDSCIYATHESEVLVYNIYTDSSSTDITVTATTVTAGEYKVNVWADGIDFGIDLDGVTEDSTALSAKYMIVDNSNDWVLSMPYFNYYEHTVSDTLIIDYEPITMIIGTVLPDKEGSAQNGVVTWGSNPVGVTATLGSLVPAESALVGLDPDDTTRDVFADVGVSDWFAEPDISVRLAANPLRPLVTIMSDSTTMTELQAWRLLGLALVLFVTIMAAAAVKGHLFISGATCAGVIGILVQQTIWPMWALIFIIPAIVAGLIAERTPQIG